MTPQRSGPDVRCASAPTPPEAAADLLEPDSPRLGELLAAESGKPIAQAEFEVGA
ncbi:MAG: hypothetical protein U0807_19220 [Candidatus Binatia bacterium]